MCSLAMLRKDPDEQLSDRELKNQLYILDGGALVNLFILCRPFPSQKEQLVALFGNATG